MGQFDFFVVNVAAPNIQADLGLDEGRVELVIAAYAVTYAAGLITGGRLGDVSGRKRVFILGMAAFAVTSALCGLAQSGVTLIAARAVQGLAAAVMLPQVLAIINTAVPRDERAAAMGWFGVASGIGSIAGQGLGGWLVEASPWGLGWRSIFFINVPIMACAMVAAVLLVPQLAPDAAAHNPAHRRIDPWGSLGLCVGMGLVVAAMSIAQRGLPWWAVLSLGLGVAALAATVWVESARRDRGQAITFDPALFRLGSMRLGGAAICAFMLYFASFMFVLALVLQRTHGLSPAAAGLVFVPSGLTFMAGSMLAPRLGWDTRTRVLYGCPITAAGLAVALVASLLSAGNAAPVAALVATVIATGFGNGLVLPELLSVAMRDVPDSHAGMASGTITTLQQFGAALGVTVVGYIFFRSGSYGLIAVLLIHIALLAGIFLAVRRSYPRRSSLGATSTV